MNATPESARTDEDAEHAEILPKNEKDNVEQGIPTELVGTTTDIPSRDWVGSGHSGPDDESLEEPDDEPHPERTEV